MKASMSGLIYGETKAGKSTVLSTMPGKKLILDAEGAWAAMEGRPNPNRGGEPFRLIEWDPSDPPPENTDDWDICVVTMMEWRQVDLTLDWLLQGKHPFMSVGIDSVTEIQDRCMKNIAGTEQLRTQHWGELLRHMSDRIKRFRDVVKNPKSPAHCIMFTAEARHDHDTGKHQPHMQGSIKNSIGYWVNAIGYLKAAQVPDAQGLVTDSSPVVRRLLIGKHNNYVTGSHFEDRFEKPYIDNPNIQKMMETIFPKFNA